MEKQNIIKTFFKTSLIYFFGKIATYLVSFLMLKYYTNNISPEDYGKFEYLSSIYQVIVPVLFIEIWSGLLRFTINKDSKEKKSVISSISILTLPFIVLYSIIFCVICIFVDFEYSVQMYIISILFLVLNILMMTTRAFESNKTFALSGLIGACVNAFVSYVLIRFYGLKVNALLFAIIANYVVQIIYLFVDTKYYKYFSINAFNGVIAKRVIIFCLPFSINTILYFINTNYYKIVVNNELGSDILGKFSVSTKFCMIVTFVVSIFHLAWQEITFSQSENSSRVTLYNKGMKLISEGVLISTLAIIPFTKLISPFFIGVMYYDATVYIPLYYITIYFTSISGFYYNTLAAENITIFHPIAKFFAAISNLLIIYLFIDKIGIYAIIVGAIICSIVEWCVLLCISIKKLHMELYIMQTIVFLIIYCIGTYIFYQNNIMNFIYLILLVLSGVLYLCKSNQDIYQSLIKKLKFRKLS